MAILQVSASNFQRGGGGSGVTVVEDLAGAFGSGGDRFGGGSFGGGGRFDGGGGGRGRR